MREGSASSRFHSARFWNSMNSGSLRSIARIAATTHSDTGPSWTPTALQTVKDGGTRGKSQSTPALSDWATRNPGSCSNKPGRRSANSKLSTTNSTSGAGSDTSSTLGGNGPSSCRSGVSGTRTFKTSCSGCFDFCDGQWLEGVLEHVLDATCQVERHLLAHRLRNIVDVLLVAPREDDLLQPHPMCGKHLLLDTA